MSEKQPDIVRVIATGEKSSPQAQILNEILNSDPIRSKLLAELDKQTAQLIEDASKVIGLGYWRGV